MIICDVIGTVVATRKNSELTGSKFLIVRPRPETSKNNDLIIAVDNVGAGISDIVLVSTGSAARAACGNQNAPIDALIVGIVDDEKKIMIEKK